jgi:hypothetical protein
MKNLTCLICLTNSSFSKISDIKEAGWFKATFTSPNGWSKAGYLCPVCSDDMRMKLDQYY